MSILTYLRLASIGLLLSTGCDSETTHDLSGRPEKLDDGWEVGSPLDFNADVTLLDSMVQLIKDGDYVNIHSLLIVKDGKLVVEEYFDGYDRDDAHQIRSATKSVGSILVGIAIDRGFVSSENVTVYEYFKDDYAPSYGWSSQAKKVSLGHLLSMMSGYDCDDHATNFGCEHAMYNTDNWVQYALDLPFAHEPGGHWAYNSSSLILAGEIVARGSGMKMEEFAERYLFEPLGVNQFEWNMSPQDRAWIGGGARMIPREMARIGLLMERGGMWSGERILSEEWIEKSAQKQGEMLGGVDYGYLWQRGWAPFGEELITAYWASGNGGQYIIILPDLEMVVVFTGGNYNSPLAGQPFRMLTRYIVPAFRPSSPLDLITLERDYLKTMIGTYSLDFEPSVTTTVDLYENNLRILTPDGEQIQLLPVSDTLFKGESPEFGPLQVQFFRNEQGEILRLVTYGSFSRYTFDKR
jgi:CubicO group peptidase (beta-lactamase class C family)